MDMAMDIYLWLYRYALTASASCEVHSVSVWCLVTQRHMMVMKPFLAW